jgi:uncharacterized protein YggE
LYECYERFFTYFLLVFISKITILCIYSIEQVGFLKINESILKGGSQMKKITLTALLILFCAALVFAEPEIKGTPSELSNYLKEIPKHVTLSGKSEVKVQADQAVVEISVKTEDDSLETALKQNQNLRAKIVKSLKNAGIPADKIAASRFSSTPQYGFFGKRPSSYEVANLMKITISDEKGFQEVAKIVDTYREVD